MFEFAFQVGRHLTQHTVR